MNANQVADAPPFLAPEPEATGWLIHDLLTHRARATPDAPAVLAGDTVYSYSHIDQASTNLGASLTEAGLGLGDRVAVVADTSVELVVGLWAALRAGTIAVPLNPTVKADKLAYILNDSAARAVITQHHLATVVLPAVAESSSTSTVFWSGGIPAATTATPAAAIDHRDLAVEVQRHRSCTSPRLIDTDLAVLMYTAGPRGVPRGAMLTHHAVRHHAQASASQLTLRADDTLACLLPLTLGPTLHQVVTPAIVGCTLAAEPLLGNPRNTLERLVAAGTTVLSGDPATFSSLLRSGPYDDLDLGGIRVLLNLTTPLSTGHLAQLPKAFPLATLHSRYGLAECPQVSLLPSERMNDKPASLGASAPGLDVYVADPDGRRAAAGVVGDLVVRGSGIMQGYWNRPKATASSLRPGPVAGEMVLHTQDQCWSDEDGFFYFAGRRDDMVTSRGERVNPREVEAVLYELGGVTEAAVTGVSDEAEGVVLLAAVVTAPDSGLETTTVFHHCQQRLESHLVPKHVQLHDALPRTTTGTVSKVALSVDG